MVDLITQEHIDNFSGKLKDILDTELRLGNVINETSNAWPLKDGITVFLRHPFHQHYHLRENIEYREINDPHLWKAEYFDKLTNHLLTCGY